MINDTKKTKKIYNIYLQLALTQKFKKKFSLPSLLDDDNDDYDEREIA